MLSACAPHGCVCFVCLCVYASLYDDRATMAISSMSFVCPIVVSFVRDKNSEIE